MKETWSPPETLTLHWDGKLMTTLTNDSSKEERLPILVSGIGIRSLKLDPYYIRSFKEKVHQNLETSSS